MAFNIILLANPPCDIEEHPIVHGHELKHRLIRVTTNLSQNASLEDGLAKMTRAANACFTGVVLSDAFFGFVNAPQNGQNYLPNLRTFLDSAKVLGINVYPEMGYFGYSSRILYHDINMAEGLPVKDAPFVVEMGANGLELVPMYEQTAFNFQNGDFETLPTSGNVVPNWSFQDSPGVVTFIDQEVKHSGNASIRVENPENDPNANGRFIQTISDLAQYRDYHLSVWIKTENFEPAFVHVLINNNEGRQLHANSTPVAYTQDWTQYHLTFNSLDSEIVNLYLGTWGGTTGKLWWDDVAIEPSPFINVLRRASTAVELRKMDGTAVLEGIDVDEIIDPLLGITPFRGAYTHWHTPPTIGIPAASSLQEGDTILASYFHTTTLLNTQICASLTEPKTIDIATTQHEEVRDRFAEQDMFNGWLWQYDEIRLHGWDNSPSYGTSGDNLAYNFSEVHRHARSIAPTELIMTYNSMFDPYHNAYGEGAPFYLAKDYWTNSWEGLAPDVTIVNWINVAPWRALSAEFFEERGHSQILAGFYDSPFFVKDWLRETEDLEKIYGVVYSTFTNDFSQIEAWADYVWGGCSFTTSTENITKPQDVLVYPNPTRNSFKIALEPDIKIERVELFSKEGKKVMQYSGHRTDFEILVHLPKDIYFVVIHTNRGRFKERIAIF